jgi:L-2-hydroxyglutarate oxidase LhgO
MSIITSDFLVIGAGIVGLSIARALKENFPDASIAVMDKESDIAFHSSGRNSGVVHAGFYYTADSLKAKFTLEGNKELTTFCEDRKIKINKCGKVVVVKDESELDKLFELKRRGDANGVLLEIIDEKFG